jgi:hypothetical protein
MRADALTPLVADLKVLTGRYERGNAAPRYLLPHCCAANADAARISCIVMLSPDRVTARVVDMPRPGLATFHRIRRLEITGTTRGSSPR